MDNILSYFLSITVQVGILFVLIAVGMVITKLKVVTKTGVDQIVDVLLYVVTPCLIVDSFLSVEFNKDTITELLIAAGCAILTHIIGIIFALVFLRVKPDAMKSVYRFGVVFSNGGFMSLPLAEAILGEKGVVLVSMYVIVFNIMTWTYGVSLFKSEQKASKLKILINPGTIGVIIGLPLFLLSVHMPEIVTKPLEYLSSLNTPLAMLVTGYFLMSANIKSGIRDVKMWIAAALRLLVVPLCCVLLFKYAFGLSGTLLIGCIIPACAPTAVNTMMLSAKFGGDTALASRLLSVTTVLSIITMPLMLMIAQI